MDLMANCNDVWYSQDKAKLCAYRMTLIREPREICHFLYMLNSNASNILISVFHDVEVGDSSHIAIGQIRMCIKIIKTNV